MPHTQQATTDESLELKVSKFHLQIAGTIITLLLAAVVYFLAKAGTQLETLSQAVTEFTIYQKTNDLELNELKKDFAEHTKNCKENQQANEVLHKDHAERLIKIEAKI